MAGQMNPTDTLEPSDIDRHFAALMLRLARKEDPLLALAASLASSATSRGDVCVRLADVRVAHASTVDHWTRALRSFPVVGKPGEFRPLILDESGRLYLYRYWAYENRFAENVLARAADVEGVDDALLREGLGRHFPHADDVEQKLAAAIAVMRRFCVISGGPGTGKTTTVTKILALLAEQARGRKLEIGLAAPTGKAAARVQDAMRAALDRLALDPAARACMPAEASTIHRLLGARADSVYFRHRRDNPLPLDVLVVDEASMADLALAAKLFDALPLNARLILLGDKDQLASVEAGAVLGDLCAGGGASGAFAKRLASVAQTSLAAIRSTNSTSPLASSIALLRRSYRFGGDSGIGALARLVNDGNSADSLALLEANTHADIAWRTMTAGELRSALQTTVIARFRSYFDAVQAGEAPQTVFEQFNRYRVLCAHRRGMFGAIGVNRTLEELLEDTRLRTSRETWYAGRPVMITHNDYNLKLFNGDVGIALVDRTEGVLKVYFPDADRGWRAFAPSRVPEHETVYAMTVHKAQGSEFGEVLLILPEEQSPILSRELVYTGITRAMQRVEIWGSTAAFGGAVERRLTRTSALRERLWDKR